MKSIANRNWNKYLLTEHLVLCGATEICSGSNPGPSGSQVCSFCPQRAQSLKAEKSAKMWDRDKHLSRNLWYLFSIFLLSSNSTYPTAPAPTLCGCEESVPQTPPTPTQVQSLNLGLTNQLQYSTSPARTTGPRDIHMDPSWARILSWDSDRLKRGERGLSFSKLIRLG